MDLLRRGLGRYGDVLLAAVVVLLGLLQTILDNNLSSTEIALNSAIAVGLGVLLVFRRRIALLLLALMLASALAEPLIGESGNGEFFGLFVLVAVYTAAAHTESRRMWLAGAMTAVMAGVVAVNDPESRVAKLKAGARNYALLTELQTRPRTSYLAALRNPNTEIPSPREEGGHG